MNRFWDFIRRINEDWNDLPKKLLLIVCLIAVLFLALYAFPYVAPFALAAVFAWMIEPLVRKTTELFGGKKIVRVVSSAVFVAILAGLVIVLLTIFFGRVIKEIGSLASFLPGWVGDMSAVVIDWVQNLDLDFGMIDNSSLEQTVMRLLSDATSMITSMATRLASTVARGAFQAASFLPQGILFVVLTLMGTFYMTADKDRVMSFLSSLLPEKHRQRSNAFRSSILRAIFSQIRAALVMMLILFAIMTVGFLLMGLDYAVLLALIIAVLDALPVLGAGLFLLPMFLYGLLVGNATLAIGSVLIYLAGIVIRQFVEPRIIGHQLGLHPLATMMAMYAGLIAMGFIGMILGPTTLLLCKVALSARPESVLPNAKEPLI